MKKVSISIEDEIKFDEEGNFLITIGCEGCGTPTILVCRIIEKRLDKK